MAGGGGQELACGCHRPHAQGCMHTTLCSTLAYADTNAFMYSPPHMCCACRSGVVAALAAACNRLQVGAADLCHAVAAALQPQRLPLPPDSTQAAQDAQQAQHSAEVAIGLLCLDSPVQLLEAAQQLKDGAAPAGGRGAAKLSAPGCAILIQLLKMPLVSGWYIAACCRR